MARVGPAGPPLLKQLNERTVLDTIRAAAPISRAEISRRAGISKPTVSLALQSLRDAGLVREAREGPDGPSYGAVYFEPVPEAALVLGLALGARWLGVARDVDDFVFLSVGTGMGAGLVLAGELHRGHHGAAGEVDFALGELGEELDPSAPAVTELAAALAEGARATALSPP